MAIARTVVRGNNQLVLQDSRKPICEGRAPFAVVLASWMRPSRFDRCYPTITTWYKPVGSPVTLLDITDFAVYENNFHIGILVNFFRA